MTAAAQGNCRCSDCLFSRRESVGDIHSWLSDWAPRAERTTPEGWRYANAESFVLEHGRPFDVEPLTNDDRLYIWGCVARAGVKPAMSDCFRNSRRTLVLGDVERRLAYMEGYVGQRAIQHGWLLLNDEKVVDLTLRYRAAGIRLRVPRSLEWLGGPPNGEERGPYFGVVFPTEYVRASDWTSRFALADAGPKYRPAILRDPWPVSSEERRK